MLPVPEVRDLVLQKHPQPLLDLLKALLLLDSHCADTIRPERRTAAVKINQNKTEWREKKMSKLHVRFLRQLSIQKKVCFYLTSFSFYGSSGFKEKKSNNLITYSNWSVLKRMRSIDHNSFSASRYCKPKVLCTFCMFLCFKSHVVQMFFSFFSC